MHLLINFYIKLSSLETYRRPSAEAPPTGNNHCSKLNNAFNLVELQALSGFLPVFIIE